MFFKKIQLANNPFCKTLTWVVLAAFLFSTACTTTRVISRPIDPQPDTLQNELKKGDLVNVTTKGGNSFKLRIADLSSEAIMGLTTGRNKRELRILFTEIAEIEKLIEIKETDTGKTFAATLGILLLIVGIGAYQWANDPCNFDDVKSERECAEKNN